MNTMVRSYAVSTVKGIQASWLHVTARGVALTLFVVSIFLTAIGVVYLKDYNRRLFIQEQTLQTTQQNDQIMYGKLLLEQSTLATQARVQRIATQNLGMEVPANKHIVVINDAS